MKTKINLTLLTVLLASLTFVSCEQLPGDIEWTGEFPELGISHAEYTITFNEEAKSEGYVKAFIKNGEEEIGVNRANEGDEIFLRARGYLGIEFLKWISADVTLSQPEADETSFIMPAKNVSFQVEFENTSEPVSTPVDIIKKIGYTYNPISGQYTPATGDRDLEANIKLRAWKAAQKKQTFVWFDAWSGRKDTGANSMRGLPDEVTIIAQWGQPKWNLSDYQKADMQYVQEVKGTKVVVTLFSAYCGADVEADPIYQIGDSSDEATIRPAIAKYAKALYQKVIDNGYDGYDWDFEPGGGGSDANGKAMWTNSAQRQMFVEELSYYFGKEAKTKSPRNANGFDRGPAPTKDLLFLVDGEVHVSAFKFDFTYNVDYYVQQAYGSTSTSDQQYRIGGIVNQLVDHISSGKLTREEAIGRCILTENFENGNLAASGGGLLGMATVQYEGKDTGGFGAYRVGNSYRSTAEVYKGSAFYTHLRKAIDLQYGEGPRE